MAADRMTQAVRDRLGLGRLLPLGPAEDGCWIAEQAAAGLLRRSVTGAAGLRITGLRIAGSAAAEGVRSPVPAPPSALPHGPVRFTAECALEPDAALPGAAEELRAALVEAAETRLGFLVEAVDLHVTELVDEAADTTGGDDEAAAAPLAVPVTAGPTGLSGCAGRAAGSVPGVLGPAPVLGGSASSVHEHADGHHVQLEIAVAENRRTLDVARAARAAVQRAVTAETGGPVTVAVLVTAVRTR